MDIECLAREGIALEVKRIALCHQEGYVSQLVDKKLTIEASTALGEEYGRHQTLQFFKGGAIKERLGMLFPKFALRPLGISGDATIKIGKLQIAISSALLDPIFRKKYLDRSIFLGFNAILIGLKSLPSNSDVALDVFKEVLSDIQQKGLQVILCPSFSTSGECIQEENEKLKLQGIKGILQDVKNSLGELVKTLSFDVLHWESRMVEGYYRQAFSSEDSLSQVERIGLELELVEGVFKKEILFSLPAKAFASVEREAQWLMQLMNCVGPKTALTFPAFIGNTVWGYPVLHPFFKRIQTVFEPAYAAVFPLIICENFIPLVSVGELLKKLSSMQSLGLGVFLQKIPPFQLENWGYLWSLGQSFYDGKDPLDNFSVWSQSTTPLNDPLSLAKDIVKEMELAEGQIRFLEKLIAERGRDRISSQECRAFSELIVNRLRLLEMQCKTLKNKNSSLPHLQIFDTLQQEGKDVLLRVMQSYNFSLQLS